MRRVAWSSFRLVHSTERPAYTEALNEAEEAGSSERAQDNAGGVRVERRVRRAGE